MSNYSTEAVEAYEKAKKKGEKDLSAREAAGKLANLPVLDTILENKKISGEKRAGLQEIPLDSIIGTKTIARSESFAHNFMPLLPMESEFGSKWISLYKSQLEEGLRDPIKVYKYFDKYYVSEGNKRVSVMKYLDAPTISGQVIEIVPARDETPESRLYYEHKDFQEKTGIDFLKFLEPQSYHDFENLLALDEDTDWNEEKVEKIRDAFQKFSRRFLAKGGDKLKISPADAFLLYLEIYGLEDLCKKNNEELDQEITKIWPDFEQYPKKPEVKLITKPEEGARRPILNLRFDPLKVAFVHSRDPETSSWTAKHEDAKEYVQKLLPYDIKAKSYYNADGDKEMEVMEQAVKDGAEVIFTTSPNMLRSSIKLAAKYPKLKILNCSLNTRTGHLRTYFARMFEIQFLFGMTAGILTQTNQIGYVADYPIYGMIANINAFALGVQMVNPRAKIYLDWSTTKHSMLEFDKDRHIDITFIAGEEFDPHVLSTKEYGLYDTTSGKFLNLANITYYWGAFYLKLIQSILHNTYKRDAGAARNESVNYWYGLSNGTLGFQLSDELPKQTRRLIEVMKDHMSEGNFNLFSTELVDQDGNIRNRENEAILPEDIVNMDWLLDNIVGTIPNMDDFSSDARTVIKMHGVPKIKEVSTEESGK